MSEKLLSVEEIKEIFDGAIKNKPEGYSSKVILDAPVYWEDEFMWYETQILVSWRYNGFDRGRQLSLDHNTKECPINNNALIGILEILAKDFEVKIMKAPLPKTFSLC